jgi:hypothetical protein
VTGASVEPAKQKHEPDCRQVDVASISRVGRPAEIGDPVTVGIARFAGEERSDHRPIPAQHIGPAATFDTSFPLPPGGGCCRRRRSADACGSEPDRFSIPRGLTSPSAWPPGNASRVKIDVHAAVRLSEQVAVSIHQLRRYVGARRDLQFVGPTHQIGSWLIVSDEFVVVAGAR